MTELHPNHSHQVTTDLLSKVCRMTEAERRPIEPRAFVPRSNKSSHLNWEMLVIWSFVVVSFAALFFAGYVIWAKCQIK